MNIQAVQTFYNGTFYRSRIEARWAVFFDVMGVQFEYEPEKFDLPSGRYIPDFVIREKFLCIPAHDCMYVEVKGAQPTTRESMRFGEFSRLLMHGTDSDAIMVHGSIRDHSACTWTGDRDGRIYQCPFCGRLNCLRLTKNDDEGDWPLSIIRCPEMREWLASIDMAEAFFAFDLEDSPCIKAAMSCAQSARFEDPSIAMFVRSAQNTVSLLKDQRVFCSNVFFQKMQKEADRLKAEGLVPVFQETLYIRNSQQCMRDKILAAWTASR